MSSLDENQFENLRHGKLPALFVRGSIKPPMCILAGSFDPLHEGHLEMANLAQKISQCPCVFEICVQNADKPPLEIEDVVHRLGQFKQNHLVVLTKAATFVEKARIFPNSTFVVGADTISRIAELKYYADDSRRLEAFQEISQLNCRFLVFGRQSGDQFQTLDDLQLPIELVALCMQVPKADFAMNVSSTQIRTNRSNTKAAELMDPESVQDQSRPNE